VDAATGGLHGTGRVQANLDLDLVLDVDLDLVFDLDPEPARRCLV
jgi:hypothetical protein